MSKLAVLDWDHSGEQPVLQVSGHWTLEQRKPELVDVWRRGGRLPEQVGVQIAVEAWDSSLLALLRRLQRLAGEHKVTLDMQGLPDGVERLLEMAATPSTQAQAADNPEYGWVSRIGLHTISVGRAVARACTFVGEVVQALGRLMVGKARMRMIDFWMALQQCGPGALPIVALIAILIGLILAFVGAVQLEAFGAQLYIANMVSIGMTREMGALMTAVIMKIGRAHV